ncbi:MAG: hypothetical protein QXK47_02485 [Candidatus Bathyarchaeia archaeon]
MNTNNQELKIIFNREKVLAIKSVDFGLFGCIESRVELDYTKFPMVFPTDKPLLVTKIEPIFKDGRIESLVFTTLEYQNNPQEYEKPIKNHQKNRTVVGSCHGLQKKKFYKVYASDKYYYIEKENGIAITSQAKSMFEKILGWLRRQMLPTTYKLIEANASKEDIASPGVLWTFTIIALAKGLLKASYDAKKQCTILSFA